jgi:hypothetical protein
MKNIFFIPSNNKCGLTKSARARAIRIRHPPEKSLHFFRCICLVKPKPCKSRPARASA